MPDPTLAQALVALREQVAMHQAVWRIVQDAEEAGGDLAVLVCGLEQEAELLRMEIETLKRERADAARQTAGDPARRKDDHE